MESLNIEKYQQNYINEGCISVNQLQEVFINFDKLRLEFFPPLRSVDFIKIDKDKIDLIEITELRRTVRELAKRVRKYSKVRTKEDSYIVVELLKAEYREKLFESLFLLQFIGKSLENKKVCFFIVLCNASKIDMLKFKFLEEFLKSLVPKNWFCKILLSESFKRKLTDLKGANL
jgi:hypothetical protein